MTGANGFVGRALVPRLLGDGWKVRAAIRQGSDRLPSAVECTSVGDIGSCADWGAALSDVDAVVHLAARVHVMREVVADPLAEFRRTNVLGTENLARQAAAAGIRRFVLLSSIKVNGESGICSESNDIAPKDDYAVSKREAELSLARIAADSRMEFVVIRPPLVYGPGVKGNFRSLMRAVERGVPLPFGAINNRRSLVGLDNLVDFIALCLRHPAAGNQTFLVSDGEDLSTAELVRRLAREMGRPARLISVPAGLLSFAAALLNRRDVARRLIGSLEANTSKASAVLGWKPLISVDEGLRRAVASLAKPE